MAPNQIENKNNRPEKMQKTFQESILKVVLNFRKLIVIVYLKICDRDEEKNYSGILKSRLMCNKGVTRTIRRQFQRRMETP